MVHFYDTSQRLNKSIKSKNTESNLGIKIIGRSSLTRLGLLNYCSADSRGRTTKNSYFCTYTWFNKSVFSFKGFLKVLYIYIF